jgi:hypothetical protein
MKFTAEDAREVLGSYHALLGEVQRPQRNPLSTPVSLERVDLPFLLANRRDYVVSPKADGCRVALFFTKTSNCGCVAVAIDRALTVQLVRSRGPRRVFDLGTILDCELVTDTYLIFDVLVFMGEDVRSLDYLSRLEKAKSLTNRLDLVEQRRRVRLCVKDVAPLDELQRVLDAMPKLAYETDGLVLTPIRAAARAGTHREMFKLKTLHSIDLQVRLKSRELLVGLGGGPSTATARSPLPLDDGLVVDEDFWPLAEALGLAEDGIVECALTLQGSAIVLSAQRLRNDKRHPNSLETVRRTVVNVRENINVEELTALLERSAEARQPSAQQPLVQPPAVQALQQLSKRPRLHAAGDRSVR